MRLPVKLDFSNRKTLEKYSSAVSLSDMEIFVFPELFYPLVISNIMSPIIWTWPDDPWFKGIQKKSFNYKINRIKQFIMDHYAFNLDLETWGLTDKETEMERFSEFLDMDVLKQSNALFGYEGDKYYYDIDIRKHFGLDKYTTDTIPYWKTETVEAMTAFRNKPGFTTGAGECVSFSALYAAALFIVGRIPLEKIFLVATPLHSQNFIDIDEGIITNNRRIVTKSMWFNGTPITTKARRALEKERVTIVSHISGYIHRVFQKATIDPAAYHSFASGLKTFLKSDLTPSILLNFLRNNEGFRASFQFRHKHQYLTMENLFAHEQVMKVPFNFQNEETFFEEISPEKMISAPIAGRIVFQDAERYLQQNQVSTFEHAMDFLPVLAKQYDCNHTESFEQYVRQLMEFIHVHPQLPAADKHFHATEPLSITVDQTREEIVDLILKKAKDDEVASLALYTYRQMDKISWKPFLKAAIERNPVSLKGLEGLPGEAVYQFLFQLPNESIYNGVRLAQPDEVWNFQKGDGIEKAILLINYLYHTSKNSQISLTVEDEKVTVNAGGKVYHFFSTKGLNKKIDCSKVLQYCCSQCC